MIGSIPRQQVGLSVLLTAGSFDLDIQIYDTEDNFNPLVDNSFDEGRAVIAWCSPLLPAGSCNRGVIDSATLDTAIYKDATYEYSGFNGEFDANSLLGNKGDEYITVSETTTSIDLYAYAYQTGVVDVSYSWEKTITSCCLGTEACSGTDFTRTVAANEVSELGVLESGYQNIRIDLTSTVDIDIQLFTVADGTPIIRWCDPINILTGSDCVKGFLGNQGSFESYTDPNTGVKYDYSGFDGESYVEDGQTKYRRGNEYIEISGVLTEDLMMKVYGFNAGSSKVVWSYFNTPTN